MPEQGPTTIFLDVPDVQFPEKAGTNTISFEGIKHLAGFLTAHSLFSWDKGFLAAESRYQVAIGEALLTARCVSIGSFGITLGERGILRIQNPDAPEHTQNTWYIVPLYYEGRDDYGVLSGVFVDNKEDGTGINTYFGQLLVRNHVITGFA